jgi:membrane-bound ClpP family serine protease
MLHGEIWKAESIDEEINDDENVRVIERSDLLLKVKRI